MAGPSVQQEGLVQIWDEALLPNSLIHRPRLNPMFRNHWQAHDACPAHRSRILRDHNTKE